MQEVLEAEEGQSSAWGKSHIPPALCLGEEALGDSGAGTENLKIQRERTVSPLTQDHRKLQREQGHKALTRLMSGLYPGPCEQARGVLDNWVLALEACSPDGATQPWVSVCVLSNSGDST